MGVSRREYEKETLTSTARLVLQESGGFRAFGRVYNSPLLASL